MKMLSIIIPCLNEEDNISNILNEISSLVMKYKIPNEIIIVDDQSHDLTLSVANQWIALHPELNVRLIYKQLERRGYGAAVKYGLAHAVGKFAIFVSADLVDPIDLIPQMYKKMLDGADVVQCSRYLNSNDSDTIPYSYKFFQFFFRIGVQIALGEKIPDSTYAFKMFDRAKIQGMGIASNRFNVSPEIMFKSILANLNIIFIPGSQGVRYNGVSKFHFHKEGVGFGLCLLRAALHRKKILFWF